MASRLNLAAMVAATLGFGLMLGYWVGRHSIPPPAAPRPMAPAPDPAPSAPPPRVSQIRRWPGEPGPARAQPQAAPTAAAITNWQERIAAMAADEDPDGMEEMAMSLPQFPEEDQLEVAQDLSILLPDQQYALVGQYLTNRTVSGPVLDVLVAGLLSRPNGLRLPYLLAMARDAENPRALEARSLLQVMLDADFGQDWDQWQSRVDQAIRDDPD